MDRICQVEGSGFEVRSFAVVLTLVVQGCVVSQAVQECCIFDIAQIVLSDQISET